MLVRDLSKSFHPVPKPKDIEKMRKEKPKTISKKSKKLAKLEKDRFSIITKEFDKCYVCRREVKNLEKHEVFGGRNRQTSMKYGLVIPVCRTCHSLIPEMKPLNEKLHKVGQKAFEKKYKNENFTEIFGKNYL